MVLLNPPLTIIGFGTLKKRMLGLQSKVEKWAIINKRRVEVEVELLTPLQFFFSLLDVRDTTFAHKKKI